MAPEEFERWVVQFDAHLLSHERDLLLQTAAREHAFSAEQLAALMTRFSFDRERVAVAVQLWPRVVDPAHSKPVFDALTFIHSRDELARRLKVSVGP